jgi:Spy/CpxP family protein refolding chaperone
MQHRRASNRKWLGIALIVLGVLILAAGLSGRYRLLFGHMDYGYGPGGNYGHHMMGAIPMWGGWTGGHPMSDSPTISPEMAMMPWPDETVELDLSDEQERRIRTIREQFREKRRDLLDRIRQENDTMTELLRADSPEPEAVGEQYTRRADLGRQMLMLGLQERLRIDEVLTSEQRDLVRERRRAWMMHWNAF